MADRIRSIHSEDIPRPEKSECAAGRFQCESARERKRVINKPIVKPDAQPPGSEFALARYRIRS